MQLLFLKYMDILAKIIMQVARGINKEFKPASEELKATERTGLDRQAI